jgi:hypothetical protein
MVGMTELPPEGDEEEAQRLVRERPLELPTYRLERVHVAMLNVDYAPPYGNGYARPLSPHRLAQLRREWDPLAVSPLVVSRRNGGLFVVDGNHRRFVAYEKGMLQLPAMVHQGLTAQREAALYTKLGTVLGQTPWTRFQAKIASGDEAAFEVVKIADRYGLEINGSGGAAVDGRIMAVARVEWIFARGGPDALNWVLALLTTAFDGIRESLAEMPLEGTFMFYMRHAERVSREEVACMLAAGGFNAWEDRAAALWSRVDVGKRSNTYGLAIAEQINEIRHKQGKSKRELLPAWESNAGAFGSRYRDVAFSDRQFNWRTASEHNPAPQQLTDA